MAAAIGLRNDLGSLDLRALARTTRDASQARRLLALAEIYDGGSRKMPPGSAVSACRRCATGSYGLTGADRMG